jgi:hemoglobin
MIPRRLTLALGLASALAGLALTPRPAVAQATQSLYLRLGRYDGIAAFTDEFLKNLANRPSLGRFFTGLSDHSRKRLRQHVVDFLCEATGGPCFYQGRDMKTAHRGLAITEKDWEEGVKALVQTLDAFEVKGPTRDEVIAAVSAQRNDIVESRD